jgi:hypothetical protein
VTHASVTSTSVPVSPRARGVWRSARGVLLVGVIVVVGAALPVLLAGPAPAGGYLDPRDTSLDGGAALAALLRERAVNVTRVDSVQEAVESAGAGTRVLVSRPDTLPRAQAVRLVASESPLLVIGTSNLGVFLPGARARAGAPPQSLAPACDLPAAVRAGSAYLGGATLDPGAGRTGCYPAGGHPTLASADGVTLVTAGEFMTNRRLDEDGNAALALNLAGADRRLVWLVAPDADGAVASAPGGGPGLVALVPAQVWWAAGTLAFAVLLTALWSGRRLGPVVAEALPVVVRAAETVEGRGRLYRARRAREQAARALCAAAAERIAVRTGLTTAATPGHVVGTAAARIGQDARQVERLLYGPVPDDDRALVRLADELDVLERRVRER